jgi:cysteinyl-tRNA synthetase
MSDDFNTSLALSLLVPLAKEINKSNNLLVHENDKELLDVPDLISKWFTINHICDVLGLKTSEVIEDEISISEEEIEQLIQERLKAKQNKDYQKGNEIREYLNEKGIKLIDSKNNTTWIKEV